MYIQYKRRSLLSGAFFRNAFLNTFIWLVKVQLFILYYIAFRYVNFLDKTSMINCSGL